jgi:hypothetical protein
MQNCTGNDGGYVITLLIPVRQLPPRRNIMKIRIAFATLLAAIFFAAVPATYAAVGSIHSPAHAMFFSGQKKIKFNLSNQTGAPLELKIGDQVTTLQAGQIKGFNLPVGTRVTMNSSSGRYHAGDVIVEVSTSMYSDSTISLGK